MSQLSIFPILFLISQILINLFAVNANATFPKPVNKFRISGGYRPQTHTLAKHIVSLRKINETHGIFGASHFCAGSIISPSTVVTAAHCVIEITPKAIRLLSPESICIAAGSPLRLSRENTKIIKISKIFVHPQFDAIGMKSDIALLQLAEDIVEDDTTAQRIPLANQKPQEGTECITAGWGKILNKGPMAAELTYTNIVIRSQRSCSAIYKSHNDRIICSTGMTNEDGLCKGDSGGPLICDGRLVGITSFGFCGATQYPYGFTNVYYFRNWIENPVNQGELHEQPFPLVIACAVYLILF